MLSDIGGNGPLQNTISLWMSFTVSVVLRRVRLVCTEVLVAERGCHSAGKMEDFKKWHSGILQGTLSNDFE